jgi:hypothetical protein
MPNASAIFQDNKVFNQFKLQMLETGGKLNCMHPCFGQCKELRVGPHWIEVIVRDPLDL